MKSFEKKYLFFFPNSERLEHFMNYFQKSFDNFQKLILELKLSKIHKVSFAPLLSLKTLFSPLSKKMFIL
jgi:hypothetical protein